MRALITGITGQDGSYLAEFLLDRGYTVYGLVRRRSQGGLDRIEHLLDQIHLINGDLLDTGSLVRALEIAQPQEVYNLAAQSFVPASWEQPEYTMEVTGLGVLRVLEAILQVNREIRFFQASSSEIFGKVRETPQKETTPFYPRSPYGAAKAYGHWITVNYRESHGLFAVSGILFNHESPRRGLEFVTRKITRRAAEISLGLAHELSLGNLKARRDWGHARDTVRGMWQMLQAPIPQDYVLATGETHAVGDVVELAFGHLGLDWTQVLTHDPRQIRPAEVEVLRGDASKARSELGWEPQITFQDMIIEMVEADLHELRGRA